MSLRPSLQRLKSLNHLRCHTKCLYHSIASSLSTASELNGFSVAHQGFDEMPQRSVSDTNRLLFQYAGDKMNIEAVNLFVGAHRLGPPVDGRSLSCILKVCGVIYNQILGKQVHCHCIKSGFFEDVSVGTSLIAMYMKSENVGDGRAVFSEMSDKNVVSWTSLLAGFTWNGLFNEAVDVFFEMLPAGINLNSFTFAAVLGALANCGLVEKGIRIHAMVIKSGFELATFVCNSLISMYSKSGMINDAKVVFDGTEDKTSVSWNCLIAGFITSGHNMDALELFNRMMAAEIDLSQSNIVTVLKLCANIQELGFARQVHSRVMKSGFGSDPNILTALMVSYTKCSEMNDASKIFSTKQGVHNVVSWTAIMNGYLENGEIEKAAELYRQMNRECMRDTTSLTSSHIKVILGFVV